MGWSCGAAAGDLLHDIWSKQCVAASGSQNSYTGKDGYRYFFEVSRTEHDDGAITGTTWKTVTLTGHVRRAGSWRIDGDGTVTRYPTSWPFAKDAGHKMLQDRASVHHLQDIGWFNNGEPEQCPSCRTTAERGDRFCAQCGTQLLSTVTLTEENQS